MHDLRINRLLHKTGRLAHLIHEQAVFGIVSDEAIDSCRERRPILCHIQRVISRA